MLVHHRSEALCPRYVPPEVPVAGDCFNVIWLTLRRGKHLQTEIILHTGSKLAQLLKDHAKKSQTATELMTPCPLSTLRSTSRSKPSTRNTRRGNHPRGKTCKGHLGSSKWMASTRQLQSHTGPLQPRGDANRTVATSGNTPETCLKHCFMTAAKCDRDVIDAWNPCLDAHVCGNAPERKEDVFKGP